MSIPIEGTPVTSAPSSLLGHGLRTWNDFWFRPADPTTICFIRVCTAAMAFYICLTYSWGLLSYVGPNAWVDTQMNKTMQSIDALAPETTWTDNYQVLGKRQMFWSIYYDVTSIPWIIAIHVFFLVCMALFTVGLWCPYTSVLSWIGIMSYVQRSWATVYGMDTMLLIVMGYLLIAPTGAVFSLDRWLAVRRARRLGRPEPEVAPSVSANFAIRLLQVHLCLIYFAGGTSKLLGASWWNGTAVSQVMLNPLYSPMESPAYYYTLKFLASQRWLWELVMSLGTLFTLSLELSFIFLIWDKRWRPFLMCCSIVMHLGIGIFMGLTTFSIIMMIMVASFFSPASIRLLLAQLGDLLARLRRKQSNAVAQPEEKLVMTH